MLISGASLGEASKRFGVSKDSLSRHANRHLSPALVAMRSAARKPKQESLQERIEGLIARAETIYEAAAEGGRGAQALAAVKELRGCLELLGKATGELRESPQVVVNLQSSEEWQQLRSALLAALLPFPEARIAAAAVLELPAADVTEEAT